MKFHKQSIKLLSDTITPVNIYLKLRDKFPGAFLLESSDYHGNENSYSFIGFDQLAAFSYGANKIKISLPNQSLTIIHTEDHKLALEHLKAFAKTFEVQNDGITDHLPIGLFGYTAYDAVQSFEDIELEQSQSEIPTICYKFFKYLIAINHFKNEMHVIELLQNGQTSGIQHIQSILQKQGTAQYPFYSDAAETSNFTDEEFLEVIGKAKENVFRGDVFQLVISRKFQKEFKGDDFNVYRALRCINPSPYLFYFDFGSFKIFGSSPEAQLQVKNNKAKLFPIAGTFRRSGNDEADAKLAEALKNDPKETAEHVMLVDLARNDLSKYGNKVRVKTFKEIQYYSHVIHLVSEVEADLEANRSAFDVLSNSFPAGTLSGAPKYRAMQLIDQYEKGARGFYGGCIGFFDNRGNFNHAIIIRSFLSIHNTLHFQAGAGVVAHSKPQNELEEVNNKVAALRSAIELAKTI